jgi:SAM-dependent methyltransferase
VAYQIILDEISRLTGKMSLFFRQANELNSLTLLECSPRVNENRRQIYDATLGRYLASDFEMLAHRSDLKMDLTNEEDIRSMEGAFNIIICAHVLEHIPDYHLALHNLNRLLAPGGFLVLQVPLLESGYVEVTWDEFHQDNTRVYHRFGFDLVYALDQFFSQVKPVVGLLDFEITSPEIKPDKYELLKQMRQRVTVLGESRRRCYGLGSPDLCDAFVAYK